MTTDINDRQGRCEEPSDVGEGNKKEACPHRSFIRAARGFFDVGPEGFDPRYLQYGDLLAAAEVLASTPPAAEVDAGAMREALEAAWTDFLDANPDDLTSPDDLPDHALVTCEQMIGIVKNALAALAPRENKDVGAEVISALVSLRGISEVETELAASQRTIERWINGSRLRPMTEKSLRKMVTEWLGLAALPLSPQPTGVVWPDIGTDPLKGERRTEEEGRKLLREAYVRQQPGVPDQTALVWRGDLGRTLNLVTRLLALCDTRGLAAAPAPDAGGVGEADALTAYKASIDLARATGGGIERVFEPYPGAFDDILGPEAAATPSTDADHAGEVAGKWQRQARALISQAVLGVAEADARFVADGIFDYDRAVMCVADQLASIASLSNPAAGEG